MLFTIDKMGFIYGDNISKKMQSLFGHGLASLLRLRPEEINNVYNKVITAFVLSEYSGKYTEYTRRQFAPLEKDCIYIAVYNEIMQRVLFEYEQTGQFLDASLFYDAIPELNDKTLKDYITEPVRIRMRDDALISFLTKKAVNEMNERQKNNSYKALIYFLYFRNAVLYNIKGLMDYADTMLNGIFEESGDSFKIMLNLSVSYSFDGRIRENVSIEKPKDLLELEAVRLLQSGGCLKKCNSCGRYFLPAKRQDTIYCSYINEDTKKTCVQTGASKKFSDKVKASPASLEYTKVYKRYSARVRANKIPVQDFKAWGKKARRLRDKCLLGEMPYEDFLKFLSEEI